MKYSELTQKQKDLMQKVWVKHLKTFCSADSQGCRPCDRGCPCDSCHYDSALQKKYKEDLKDNHGIELED